MTTTTPTAWTGDFRVNSSTGGDQTAPVSIALADGGFIVAWVEGNTATDTIRFQRFDAAGQPVGAEQTWTSSLGDLSNPAIMARADGGYSIVASVVDMSSGVSEESLQYRHYDSNGVLVSETTVASISAATEPAINQLLNGDIIIVASNTDGVLLRLNFDAQGTYEGSVGLASSPSRQDTDPDIAVLTNGSYVTTWYDPVSDSVDFRRFTPQGVPLASDFFITNTGNLSNSEPDIVALSNGNFVVVYSAMISGNVDQEGTGVYAQIRYPNGTVFETRIQLHTYSFDDQGHPRITALSDGGFFVVWEDLSGQNGDSESYSIQGQRFAADGSRIGSQFTINEGSAGGQFDPSVELLADGRLLISWVDDSGAIDTIGTGIVARIFDPRDAHIVGTNENDVIHGRRGDSEIDGLDGHDRITGMEGDDTLNGGAGNDVLDGGDGDDTISGGSGDDFIYGGSGFNTLSGGSGDDTITAGSGDDIISGGSGNDVVLGGDGIDTISGEGGHDSLDGGAGADTMIGGTGNDIYFVDDDGDRIVERAGEGTDEVVSAATSYALPDNVEIFTSLATGSQTLSGNAGDNVISGGAGADTIFGEGGDDTISGGAGADSIDGGEGNDTIDGGFASDTIYGGSGNDTISGSSHNDFIGGNDGDDTLNGDRGADNIRGGRGNDAISGSDGDDRLYGDDGADTISGGTGEDYILAGHGSDVVNGGWGNDFIRGQDGDDNLAGSLGDDNIGGGAGNDRIRGGRGSDTLAGNAGLDTFVFDEALSSGNVDTIADFVIGDDTIELDLGIFTAISGGALAADAFHIGSEATSADHRIIYDNVAGALFYDADGSGEGAQVQFARIGTGLSLTSDDFTLASAQAPITAAVGEKLPEVLGTDAAIFA